MATVTVTLRLRRVEGRNRVGDRELAEAVAEAILENLVDLEVDDVEGESATYDVTRVLVVNLGSIDPTGEVSSVMEAGIRYCDDCGAQIDLWATGRNRRYCSDACRQSAYRSRLADLANPGRGA
jgi:hypothetical protein